MAMPSTCLGRKKEWMQRRVLEYVREHGVQVLDTTPGQVRTWLNAGLREGVAGDQLAVLLVGGEAIDGQLWQALGELAQPLSYNVYGPAECTVDSTWSLVSGARPVLGQRLPQASVYVLDELRQLAPVGVRGELCIGGGGVGRGYWQRAELTAERYVPHPYSVGGGERLYRTGDEGRYLADGRIEYLGRRDQQVKVRGYRIELGEIEAALLSHAAVQECVVLARAEAEEQRLVGYVVLEPEVAVDQWQRELREHVRQRLPEYMVPAAFVRLEALPLTANGKLDRRALPAPETIDQGSEAEWPVATTAVEEILLGLWQEVLRVTAVGLDDNFFDLGGHSLLATQLLSRVRDAFGVEVALRKLFEEPTVAGLAAHVEQLLSHGAGVVAPPVTRVQRDGPLPLSFAQQRLWFIDKLEGGSAFYNLPVGVALSGELDVDALERTLTEVVRRHEGLRTHFAEVNGEPVQVIEVAAPLPFPVTDLTYLPEGERESEGRRLAQIEASTTFDLSSGPLLRVQLLRLDETEHVVLLTLHHIASDGWSMGVLIKEVARLYEAYSQGVDSPLPELPVQYSDFAVWQRGWLQGEELERQLAYWRMQLGGELPVLELPTDRPRSALQGHRGAHQQFRLGTETTSATKRVEPARRRDVIHDAAGGVSDPAAAL